MKNLSILALSILILCIFLFLTCNDGGRGGSSTVTIGPEGGEITSTDGRLTLTFPPGALSEDTAITIRNIDPEDLPPEFEGLDPEFAYLLEPDGLEFAVPVTASLMLDEEPVQEDGSLETELALLITSSNGGLEVLENLTAEVDGDANMTTASGELSHFSPLVAKLPEVPGIINGVPDSLPVGGTFNDIATVIASRPTGLGRAFYEDESKPIVNPQFDTLQISLTPIPTIIDDENQIVFQVSLPYSCFPEGKGLYKTTIRIEGVTLIQFVLGSKFFLLNFSKGVTCAAVTPTPTPQPSPSPSPGPLTFMKTDNPNVFMSARINIVIFGKPGHTCKITCGPANNQVTLECMMPGAVCQEVFTRQ